MLTSSTLCFLLLLFIYSSLPYSSSFSPYLTLPLLQSSISILSVLNDMIRLSCDRIVHPALPLQNDSMVVDNDYSAVFYIRINAKDGLGIIKSVGEAAESNGVSVNAILQNPITNRSRYVTPDFCHA